MSAGSSGTSTPATVTTLLWVRHGQADSNRDGRFGGHSPVPLTDLGRRQAEATAAAIRRAAPTALISSDLARAVQTAEPIAAATGLALELDRDLRERSLGILDGLSFADAEARHPELWQRLMARDPALVPDGGEAVDAVYARVARAIDAIVSRHAGGRVVVVSHGLALYHAFVHVCGLGSPSADHGVFVLVDNCSVSRVEHRHVHGRARWRIRSLNDVAHLDGLAS
ncbi:MAG: histidine phosphatase family protein [Kofleriaceae bacterium]|nr:histidine phosphatase family protein [Myxococcales bacterium]MCB9563681.1 histidine phosphatase family protein [Kofleriaceae bacterium]MCB9571160.1 histidine phosphatase family protein [Kofleriaceae bacterium]